MNFQLEKAQGLKMEDIISLQKQFGKNQFQFETKNRFLGLIWGILKEPMFLLLIGACLLYFLLDETREGFMMIAAMCFVAAISIYQEFRSSMALQALKQLTEPLVTVTRSNKEVRIPSEELVPGYDNTF
jgi:P-type Ca2+ transporter type 2C